MVLKYREFTFDAIMKLNHAKTYYRRHLPHILPHSASYFVTFRLFNSLPRIVVDKIVSDYKLTIRSLLIKGGDEAKSEINIQREIYFKRFDQLMDRSSFGSQWLKQEQIAQIVAETLHYHDGGRYELICFTIMPNHVHVVFNHDIDHTAVSVTDILQSIKKYSARRANEMLKRTGYSFWQNESYDHVIRSDQEYENVIRYVIYNPVKANLCKEWKEWKWMYIKEEYTSYFM